MNIYNLLEKVRHFQYRFLTRKYKFSRIYKNGGFSGSGISTHPASGSGSTQEQTKELVDVIPKIVSELGVEIMLDAPCGDFTWMVKVRIPDDVKYVGVDIVKPLIDQNILKYSKMNRSFCVGDIVNDELPKSDLILCRDCFIHLSNNDVKKCLRNFSVSGSRYLLTTTFRYLDENTDMVSGRGWRPLNLELEPFHLPKPIRYIDEKSTNPGSAVNGKCLGLWDLNEFVGIFN